MTVKQLISQLSIIPSNCEIFITTTTFDEDGEEYTIEKELDFVYLTTDNKVWLD